MAQETVFEGILIFLEGVGVFRVILPFILVFTIMYALLERTRVLGVEKVGKDREEYPKKNLNAMVAFVAGFLVIVSSKLVAIINQTLGQVVLVVIVMVLFLLLAGSFHAESEKAFFIENKTWKAFLIIVSFLAVVFIFLEAIPGPGKEPSFLEWFFKYISGHWNTNWVGALILIILIILFMWWITYQKHPDSSSSENKKGEK